MTAASAAVQYTVKSLATVKVRTCGKKESKNGQGEQQRKPLQGTWEKEKRAACAVKNFANVEK